jgi:hypothetical protein
MGKNKAKILLTVDERKPSHERLAHSLVTFVGLLILFIVFYYLQGFHGLTIAWIAVLILVPLYQYFFSGRNQFFVTEDGIMTKGLVRDWIYRWDSFHSYTADKNTGQFFIKRSGGDMKLTSKEHFDELKSLLEEHIKAAEK